MGETPEHPDSVQQQPTRKGCQISIMFPCESDDVALAIKKQVDAIVKDVKDKRYKFEITEV